MIASLAGVVEQLSADSVVVDVGGVGYLVFAASRTLARRARLRAASRSGS